MVAYRVDYTNSLGEPDTAYFEDHAAAKLFGEVFQAYKLQAIVVHARKPANDPLHA